MRSLAEWLLLPLFLLPLLAGGAFVAWAKASHEAALAPYRADAPETVRAWLRAPDGPAAWMPEHVARRFSPGGSGTGDAGAYVTVEHPRGNPRVRLGSHDLHEALWRFAGELPQGLPVATLADAPTRLALESGQPALSIDGMDAATSRLASLLDRPDLDALQGALLPAATKGFLLRRWRREHGMLAGLDDAVRLVDAVRRWEQILVERGEALTLGCHFFDGFLVVETGTGSPLLAPDGAEGLGRQTVTWTGPADSPVHLSWIFPPDRPSDPREVWRGELVAPLAGTFVFTAHRGLSWWHGSTVRRLGPVLLAVLLLFLALPVLLLVAMRRRRKLDEARVRFINEMAHDLRTPLTSLRLHADLLTQGRGKPESRDLYLGTIAQESARLSELLENLLDIARLERGRRTFDVTAVPLAEVARDVTEAFGVLRPERRGDLETSGDPEMAALADRAALTRILANLLDNAGKFTEAGTPIRITWEQVGRQVRVVVADEGAGIAPEERSRVFERYARGGRATRDGLPGQGLGLTLVQELAEEMGGRVRLVEGARGAAFEVKLPGAMDA